MSIYELLLNCFNIGRVTSDVLEGLKKYKFNSCRQAVFLWEQAPFKNNKKKTLKSQKSPDIWLVKAEITSLQRCYANIESVCKLEMQSCLFTRLIILTSFAPKDTRTARDLSESGRPSPSYFANMADRRRCWELCSEEPETSNKSFIINELFIKTTMDFLCI